MLSSVHVLQDSIEDVTETILNIGAKNGFLPEEMVGRTNHDSGWYVVIYKPGPSWISVIESAHNPRGTAASLASDLQTFAIGMMLDEPLAWCFTAFQGNERIANYKWRLPAELLADSNAKLQRRESARLKELGVKDVSILEKRRADRDERIISSDPHVELTYRLKRLEGEVELPPPIFAPGIPAALHKATGMSTPGRLRRILGTSRLDVIAAVSEFNAALNLPDWLDMDALERTVAQAFPDTVVRLRMLKSGDH